MRVPYWLAALATLGVVATASAGPVRVGIPEANNLQYLSFWVAQGAGLFSAEGLDIQIVYPDVPNQSGMLLMQRRVDVALLQPPVYLGMIADQQPFALFANLLANDPINLIVRADVAKRLKLDPNAPLADRLRAIKGLRVAVAPEPQRRLRVLFAYAGLDADRDLQIVVRRADDQTEALASGAVDALYIHTPILQDALLRLGAVLLVNQSSGEVPPLANGQIHALAATRAYLDAHPDVIRKVTRAIANAQALIHRDRAAAVDALVKAGVDAPSRQHLETIVRLYEPAVPRSPDLSAAKLENNARLYPARSTMPDFKTVRAADFIASVHPGGVDHLHRFDLGVVEVSASRGNTSPLSNTVAGDRLREQQVHTVEEAIEFLPGVAVDHKAPRNQGGITIGGFDSRQVPLYIDGVPAYVPFDGFVDLGRYLSSNVAEISVAKGYVSPLLGPNALGGVVNLVTRQPAGALDGEVVAGTGAGRQVNLSANVGGRWQTGFASASADRLKTDYFSTAAGDRRLNSAQRDARYHARAAWAPRPSDLLVVSAVSQRGRNGVPPYAGTAPPCPAGGAATSVPCVTPRYWKWPRWDTNTYYVNSNTAFGSSASLQVRAFSSDFTNRQEMFDDAAFATMNRNASSGIVANGDDSSGFSASAELRALPRQEIGAALFVKRDTHTEQTTTFSRANVAQTTPLQRVRDRQLSIGLEDRIRVASRMTLAAGVSADRLEPLEAQDLTSDRLSVTPFPLAPAQWVLNPTASLVVQTGRDSRAFIALARKSRFPTIKDRYSYRSGRAVPNPFLRPERARTWTAGFSHAFTARTTATIEWQRSRVADEIENVFFRSPLCSGGGRGGAGSCQQAVNVGAEMHHGISVAARSTALPRVALDANYSYLHREIDGTSSAIPFGTPRHKAIGTATASLPRASNVFVTVHHQSGLLAMSDNGLALPEAAFTVFDIGAMLPIGRARVEAGIRNATNRDYFYWEGFPEAGRNLYLTARFAF